MHALGRLLVAAALGSSLLLLTGTAMAALGDIPQVPVPTVPVPTVPVPTSPAPTAPAAPTSDPVAPIVSQASDIVASAAPDIGNFNSADDPPADDPPADDPPGDEGEDEPDDGPSPEAEISAPKAKTADGQPAGEPGDASQAGYSGGYYTGAKKPSATKVAGAADAASVTAGAKGTVKGAGGALDAAVDEASVWDEAGTAGSQNSSRDGDERPVAVAVPGAGTGAALAGIGLAVLMVIRIRRKSDD